MNNGPFAEACGPLFDIRAVRKSVWPVVVSRKEYAMKRWMITGFAVCFLLSGQTGCGRSDTVYLEKASVSEDTEKIGTPETEYTEPEEEAVEPEGAVRECYVYVCGAVRQAGVYGLPEGSRIYEALALAGGLSEEASTDYVNQAQMIADGQMIWIPTEAEVSEMPQDARAPGGTDGQTASPREEPEADGRIDLNTAGMAELTTLPGIGAAKAESILAYRESHGGFSAAEDIMKVEGIKEGVYNRIKDYIRVR